MCAWTGIWTGNLLSWILIVRDVATVRLKEEEALAYELRCN